MTTHSIVATEGDAKDRVNAVWHRYAHRGGHTAVRNRAYIVYVVAVFAIIYLVPIVYLASTSPALVSVEPFTNVAPVVCAVAAAACWAAQLAGRFWGPLVIRPFLLHVFTSTDLSPTTYLGAVARRRLAYAGAATLFAVCTGAYLATDVFDQLDTALQGLGVAVGLCAFVPAAWLWGQVQGASHNLVLAGVAAMAALILAVASQAVLGGGSLWLVAGVLATGGVALAGMAFRAVRTVDLVRLTGESARASQAQQFAWTGTFHHALDLYRPEPRGLTSALIRPDGHLRGYLAQGAVRTLRTPTRAMAAVASLLIGGAMLTLGVAGPEHGLKTLLWVAGAMGVYLGSGWVSETWRGLRDELTLAPLFGQWWGGTLARTLTWPVVGVSVGVFVGAGLTILTPWAPGGGRLGETVVLIVASTALAHAARFLREMKMHLPVDLLLPIITPFGDLSGLRVLVWQFDGAVAVVLGVAAMASIDSVLGAVSIAIGVAAYCVWAGLRRTGWAHRGLVQRLRRA